ncbi:MAG: BrnT family toxin [Acidobacteriota bacterium]
MRFQELEAEWDDDNVEHIARHRVEPEEVEEIIYEDCYPSWIMRGRRRVVHETRWRLYGQTCAGRYLIVVAALYPQSGVWRAVTAMEMDRRTRRRYKQWRGN